MKLIGHSGCEVRLFKDKEKMFVRKTSKDENYNKRLIKQSKKQREYSGSFAMSPKIINDGYKDSLYYFDMKYIRGESLSSFLSRCNIREVDRIGEILILVIKENKKTTIDKSCESEIIEKIKTLWCLDNNDIVKESLSLLSSYNWSNVKKSKCHGDLTLENILYNGSFYLIDFLDLFYETWIADVSKLFQDTIVGWSFRNMNITENIIIRMNLLNEKIFDKLNEVLSDRDWMDVYHHLIMDLIRIIPYVEDEKTYDFVLKSIKSVLEFKDGLYEYIDNSSMWPINKVSKC